jgi:hypothetical protein
MLSTEAVMVVAKQMVTVVHCTTQMSNGDAINHDYGDLLVN